MEEYAGDSVAGVVDEGHDSGNESFHSMDSQLSYHDGFAEKTEEQLGDSICSVNSTVVISASPLFQSMSESFSREEMGLIDPNGAQENTKTIVSENQYPGPLHYLHERPKLKSSAGISGYSIIFVNAFFLLSARSTLSGTPEFVMFGAL